MEYTRMARKDAKAFFNVDSMLISSGASHSCFTHMITSVALTQKRKNEACCFMTVYFKITF